MNKTVSIIIPIYNCEKNIGNLIKRIKRQDYEEIEVILVNDGSTDHSLKSCIENIGEDKRFKVISKKNQGVSNARNVGLENSNGEYIMFIDADDDIFHNSISKLVEALEKEEDIDWAIGNFCINKKNTTRIMNDKISNNVEKLKLKLFNRRFDDNKDTYGNLRAVWGKLYKKKIIDSANIKFVEDIKLYEDGIFNFEYSNFIKKYCIFSDVIYVYNHNEGSAINKHYSDLYEQDVARIEYLENLLNRYQNSGEKYVQALNLLIFEFFCRFLINDEINNSKITKSDLKGLIDNSIYTKAIKNVNFKYLSKKHKIIYILIKLKFYRTIIKVFEFKKHN